MAAAELRSNFSTDETTAATPVEEDSKDSLSLTLTETNSETSTDSRQPPNTLNLSSETPCTVSSDMASVTLEVPQRSKPPETLSLQLSSSDLSSVHSSPAELTPQGQALQDQATSLLNGSLDAKNL